MGVKKKRRMTAVLAVIWCILLSVIPVFGAGDDYRIEQLYINMPDEVPRETTNWRHILAAKS